MDDLRSDVRPAKRAGAVVLLAGVATAMGTLLVLYILNIALDVSLMGFYINGILPVGALGVGLLAGSGYGIASWLTGTKINRTLVLVVVSLQIWAYFVAQFLEFALLRAAFPEEFQLSFWQYFDLVTRAFAWSDEGKAFGVWGYGMRALEIGGFVLGGLVATAIMSAKPYCDKCQTYMRKKDLATLPAGVIPRKVKKKDLAGQQAYEEEQQKALDLGQEMVRQLLEMIQAGDAEAFSNLISRHTSQKKQIEKLTCRINLALSLCPRCQSGELEIKLAVGQGQEISFTEIARQEMEAPFAIALKALGHRA